MKLLNALLATTIVLAVVGCKQEPASTTAPGLEEAISTASDAYIYGYPLVTMDMTRKRFTNVATPDAAHAPMGQFSSCGLIRRSTIMRSPLQTPTRYTRRRGSISQRSRRSSAFPTWATATTSCRCLTDGPMSSRSQESAPPATRPRSMPSPVRVGRARCRAGVTEYKSPTAMVWILGRIYCTGTPQDYAAVHALQDKFTLVPLSAYGKPYTPPRRHGRSLRRHEEQIRPRFSRCNGHHDVLQLPRSADEGESSIGRRCTAGGKDGEHRSGPRSGL